MTTPLTVQTGWYHDAESIGFFVASDRGLYAQAGLEVGFLEGGSEVAPEGVLLRGHADIAIAVRDTAERLLAADADLEKIGVQYRRDPLAVLVPDSSPIRSLPDLAGHRVVVPEVSAEGLFSALTSAGVDPASVAALPFDGSGDALSSEAADAFVGYVTTLPFDLAARGIRTRALSLAPPGSNLPQNLILARRSRSGPVREAIERWLLASAEGWRLNAADPKFFPRALRTTWFRHTARSVADEIAHNTLQLAFMGDPEHFLRL